MAKGNGKKKKSEGGTASIYEELRERLIANQSVRRRLARGQLRIDRQLPFLCVYRRPSEGAITGSDRLVTGEASYLIAPGDPALKQEIRNLVRMVVETQTEEFGAFLLLEIWASPHPPGVHYDENPHPPCFTIVTPKKGWPQKTVQRFRDALNLIRVERQPAKVNVERRDRIAPPGMQPILTKKEMERLNCWVLGLEVDPIYHNPHNGEIYPVRLLRLRRSLGRALKKGWYEFTQTQTDRRPPHYHALGPHAVTKAVWDVDERLATVSRSFDLLLNITPINPEPAWRQFTRSKYLKPPTFYYRPLEVDPELLKRGLFNIPLERVEDPTLAHLFREKQEEIDRQITLLRDRGGANFRYESMQLFGVPSPSLLRMAKQVLSDVTINREEEPSRGTINAKKFAEMANQEYHYYHAIYPEFHSSAHIRDDITQGLMVSQGNLLIGKGTSIPRNRAQALLQHEVGTHVLTYCNGKAQPLKQLYCGLAGYDEFQEGIAVLAEYLVGGLSAARLRLLAMRVVAVEAMLQGATFVEAFHLTVNEYGFSKRTAFTIVMRIFRGGGLTKDAIYLRGLQTVLEYLRDGGDMRLLFVGKIAVRHVPIIRELQYRNVLREAPLTPRYITDPEARKRLTRIGSGMSIHDFIQELG